MRNKLALEGGVGIGAAVAAAAWSRQLRWRYAIPPFRLFLSPFTVQSHHHEPLQAVQTDPTTQHRRIDRLAVEQLMRADGAPPAVSWANAQKADALRHLSRDGSEARYCELTSTRWHSVVNHLTLVTLDSEIQNLSYFSDLAAIRDAMQYLFSKTLNQRCQLRLFGEVALRCFDADREIATQLKHLVLCSLLGNYTHCTASSRPRATARIWLYSVLFDAETERGYDGWFRSLLRDTHGSLIVLYALRDYLTFAIPANPGLFRVVAPVMHFAEFTRVTTHVMDEVRRYFDVHLYEAFSVLRTSLIPGSAERHLPWCVDLAATLTNAKRAMLASSFRRPKRPLQQCFATVFKRLPMVPNPTLVIQCEEEEAKESAATDEVDAALAAYVGNMGMGDGFAHLQQEQQQQLEEGVASTAAEKAAATKVPPLSHCINKEQQSALGDVIQALLCDPSRDALKEFLPWLRHFGVPQAAIDYAATLNLPKGGEVLSDEKLRKKLIFLRTHQPHAYNLIQLATQFISDHQRLSVLSDLPVHYWLNQMDAIETRFDVRGSGCVLESMLYFVYCDVCGMVYSLLRDVHSVYKQSYSYGYRDAVVDYDTRDVYCNKNKLCHRGRCGERPLQFVRLLGRVIRYERKTILLCPQYGCGMPMVFDPAYCLFNERGVACCDCSILIHKAVDMDREAQLMATFVAPIGSTVTCDVCSGKLVRPHQMMWYPNNIIVCRHHSNAIIRSRLTKQDLALDRADLLARIMNIEATAAVRTTTQHAHIPSNRIYSRNMRKPRAVAK